MSDSENLSEYCSESENQEIGSSSESELKSGYLNELFQGTKLESYQYKPLKKNFTSANYSVEEEKRNKVVASESEDHRGWCFCRNCREESREVD